MLYIPWSDSFNAEKRYAYWAGSIAIEREYSHGIAALEDQYRGKDKYPDLKYHQRHRCLANEYWLKREAHEQKNKMEWKVYLAGEKNKPLNLEG